MEAEAMINQEAQDDATACSLLARLLGQRAPAFMGLPVLHKHLDAPSQSVGVHDRKRAPAQIGCDHIAIGVCAGLFQSDDEPFGVMGTHIQTGTAYDSHHLLPTAAADLLGCPGRGDKIVGDVLLALVHSHALITAQRADDLDPTKES